MVVLSSGKKSVGTSSYKAIQAVTKAANTLCVTVTSRCSRRQYLHSSEEHHKPTYRSTVRLAKAFAIRSQQALTEESAGCAFGRSKSLNTRPTTSNHYNQQVCGLHTISPRWVGAYSHRPTRLLRLRFFFEVQPLFPFPLFYLMTIVASASNGRASHKAILSEAVGSSKNGSRPGIECSCYAACCTLYSQGAGCALDEDGAASTYSSQSNVPWSYTSKAIQWREHSKGSLVRLSCLSFLEKHYPLSTILLTTDKHRDN